MLTHFKRSALFLFVLLLVACGNIHAQFASKVIDYLPAPGQYTNAEFMGTPAAAASLVGTNKGLVSLGAYGGSVTLYFSQGIQNDPANPYGVDFTIYGNPTLTWSEPGIVQVMKDENQNGIPDDTWYEIAGSDHFWNTTNPAYEVTFLNNGLTKAGNIQWTDNQNQSGIIPENSFHQQPYYPKPDLFPTIPTDKYTLKGTRLAGQIDLSNPGVVNSYRRAFGYADNTPVLSATEKLPDNPYTLAIEGSGGDAIDIDWAVDRSMKSVKLDVIHFIRIYTGMNALAGWLGEISTEITGVRDVEPALISGPRTMVVMQDLPLKIKIGDVLNMNALAFEGGIRQEGATINWSVNKPELATMVNGQLKSVQAGKVTIRATLASNPLIFAEKEVDILSGGKAVITLQSTSLKVNDRLELTGKFTDQSGATLGGLTPVWKTKNTEIADVTSVDGKYFLNGNQVGKVWLYLEAAEIKLIRDSVMIEVFPESARKRVYLSVKTSEKTTFIRQSVWVEQTDLTAKVDRAQKAYGLKEIPFVSLAHALASAFQSAGWNGEWAFRDDAEGGSKLYLWKVPEMEQGSTAYTFGYGGSRTSEPYRKTWVVMLNQLPVVSGFDQLKVNNDDEILVYHVPDNNLPWAVSHLTMGTDTVKTSQRFEVQLKKYFCSMDGNRTITVNSSEAIANQAIRMTLKNQPSNDVSQMTDEFGKVSFTGGAVGEYLISAGIDAARLIAESFTGTVNLSDNRMEFRIQPNPFTERVRLICPQPVTSVEIFTVQGKLIYGQEHPTAEIDLSGIRSGVYLLKAKAGSQVFQQKIIKY
jgi:hypothetical protein